MAKLHKEGYTIISKGGIGEFSILDSAGDYVTVFSYRGWFSTNGSAATPRGKVSIKSRDRWQTSFIIQRSRKNIGEIIFNWRGSIMIALSDADNVLRRFLLEQSGTSKWLLTDERKNPVLSLKSVSHWLKKNAEYHVVVTKKTSVYTEELLIACGYATNLNATKVAALKA